MKELLKKESILVQQYTFGQPCPGLLQEVESAQDETGSAWDHFGLFPIGGRVVGVTSGSYIQYEESVDSPGRPLLVPVRVLDDQEIYEYIELPLPSNTPKTLN